MLAVKTTNRVRLKSERRSDWNAKATLGPLRVCLFGQAEHPLGDDICLYFVATPINGGGLGM